MDGIWAWAWRRHGAHYAWLVWPITCLALVPLFALWVFIVLRLEGSHDYVAGLPIVLLSTSVAVFWVVLPTSRQFRLIHRWAAGDRSDPLPALQETYAIGRAGTRRTTVALAVVGSIQFVSVGVVAESSTSRLVQLGVIGALIFSVAFLGGARSYAETALRPIRMDLTGDTDVGDLLPRSRPSFATWATVTLLATSWAFAAGGAALALAIDDASDTPLLIVGIATAMTVFVAAPLAGAIAFGPSMKPLRDLEAGAALVQGGDYSRRLPVVQDDDLGVLAASFNRMQTGLAQRERLQAAFGSYVDPALAARLLDQGDDIFTGERIDVTVMFVDIRDFTPFAEANTAEDTVAHLNALFEIVVPAVLDAGGHVNKYLGDGAMAVFGAPNILANHADAAVAAAQTIQRLVIERFAGTTRVGIGINTGQVIAGTIGGGGKLEFTLIGDTVNVAARIEQLTKTTGDQTLLTEHTLAALTTPPNGLTDRGAHELKGKSAKLRVHALEPGRV